jgi:hypothetical protein
MKLITEQFIETVQLITEQDAKTKEKCYYISGVFMQADQPNRNRRVYPMEVMEREVKNYNENFIAKSRAMGELGHPESPTVNLERVSHLIKELSLDGNNVVGKAKLMDTPYGKIAKNLVDEGVKLGVSSRGLGSLKEIQDGLKQVQEDFQLNAIDIVADPSAPDAFVEGVMEDREWIYENGIIKAKQIEEYKKEIMKATKNNLEKKVLGVFKDFISKL